MSTVCWPSCTSAQSACSVKAIAGSPSSSARSQLFSIEPWGASHENSVCTCRSGGRAMAADKATEIRSALSRFGAHHERATAGVEQHAATEGLSKVDRDGARITDRVADAIAALVGDGLDGDRYSGVGLGGGGDVIGSARSRRLSADEPEDERAAVRAHPATGRAA